MINFPFKIKKQKSFTLIELLVVIAIIAVLAGIVIIAVNPARQIAQARNVRREADVRSISDALSQYRLEHSMAIPTGIDQNLKMIGTATSGCTASCGEKIGQVQKTNKTVSYFNFGIKMAQAQTPPSGWVSPTGYEDSSQWSSEPMSYDKNTGTYAQNEFGSAGWGQYIVLTLSEPISSDRLRINADYLDAHIREVDVDVENEDDVWTDVFQGGSEAQWNCKWVELSFPKESVTKVRFRYNYKVSGWWYWLYELQVYKLTEEISLPSCSTQNASSVGKTTATLNGTVISDGGEPCQYRFQYGKTTNYTNTTDWTGSISTGDSFSEFISDLSPDTKYYFRAQVKNSVATNNGVDKEFTTSTVSFGWLSPTSHSDPDNKWENEIYGYDGSNNTLARSYHNSGENQWSSFIYFAHEPIFSDKIRFFARAGGEVDQIDVDVFKDGAWVDLYQGGFTDKQWVEKSFTETMVSQARLKFHATYQSHGFYWELNEFAFHKNSETSGEGCIDLSSSLVPDYLSAIPYDPQSGSDEKTHYAVKKDEHGKIIVKSCDAELNREITIDK